MDGYEYPTQNSSAYEVYRLSWVAYVGLTLKFLLLVIVAIGTGWWALSKAQTPHAWQLGMAVSAAVLLVALAVFIYKLLHLRSVHLYTNEVGVWLYQGILPWSRGARGVKWRDIEDAMYFTGFFSWMFRSYTVRIGHRFTKTSEIIVSRLARGNKAVEHINQLLQEMLKAQQPAESPLQV